MPASLMQCPICSGLRSILTPSAASTSAAPDFDDKARLPCLATGTPAPATMKAAQVEMLNEPEASPPVPTTSMASAGATTPSILPRIAVTAPVISSTVSPRTRKAINRPPICEGVTSPDIMLSNASNAASRLSAAPVATCPMSALISTMASMHPARPAAAGGGVPIRSEVEEVLQDQVAVLGGDAFGVELDAVHRQGAMLKGHDQAVRRLRGDREIAGHRGAIDHQGMVTRRLEWAVDAAEHALALVAHLGELAVHGQGRAHDVAAEGLADRLVAEADAEHRNGRRGLVDQVEADAGIIGGAGPRRQHDRIGIGGDHIGARDH